MDEIRSLVREFAQDIITFRRALHKIPETAYAEAKTSDYVAGHLSGLGMDVQTGIARFGVVGTQVYPDAGKTLLLRSELDALPVTEKTGLPFASTHEGAMHACGHDGHMAMVLGAATVLARLKPELAGCIKFVFQPAEEGPGGAKPMIEEGVMGSPDVDYSLGCHLWPEIPEGYVGVKAGPLMAALDRFDIVVKGKGGTAPCPISVSMP